MDLYYEDGGNPSEELLQRFINICEHTKVSWRVWSQCGGNEGRERVGGGVASFKATRGCCRVAAGHVLFAP